MLNVILVIVNITLLVTGQALWKTGLEHQQIRGIGSVLAAMLSPWVLTGIALYGIATVVYIALMSRLPLSLLYPLQSLAYVATVFVALFAFGEHISITRWIGVAIILVGVGFIVK